MAIPSLFVLDVHICLFTVAETENARKTHTTQSSQTTKKKRIQTSFKRKKKWFIYQRRSHVIVDLFNDTGR